jgi:hypothetical protein
MRYRGRSVWGTTGLQVKTLLNYQLSVQNIVLWRMVFAVLILFPFIFFTNRKLLKIDFICYIPLQYLLLLWQEFFIKNYLLLLKL